MRRSFFASYRMCARATLRDLLGGTLREGAAAANQGYLRRKDRHCDGCFGDSDDDGMFFRTFSIAFFFLGVWFFVYERTNERTNLMRKRVATVTVALLSKAFYLDGATIYSPRPYECHESEKLSH